jgi:DNA polymerase (family 10)
VGLTPCESYAGLFRVPRRPAPAEEAHPLGKVMDRDEIAAVLNDIATMLELKGENRYRCLAYSNAARTIEGMAEDPVALAKEGKLTEVRGIGSTLNEKITELVTTGRMKFYEELRASMPEGLFDMLKIPGMGPKKVKAIYDKLHISTLGELEYACNENRLIDLSGFGPKSQENILKGIEYLKKYRARYLLSDAVHESSRIIEALEGFSGVIRCSLGGSIRRRLETVKDVDIVASTGQSAAVMDFFTRLPEVADVVAKGETKSTVRLDVGINVDLRTVSDREYPYALHHFTGSKDHNTAMRGRAKKMGLKMNEYGLFRGERLIPCADEEAIFKALKLDFIPPELREDQGEIDAAERGELPDLVRESDIKGVIHVHSNWSDGSATIEELAKACKKAGYKYLGLCDHSQSARYAGGLEPASVKKQQKEIDELNKKMKGFRVLKGIEADILPDGKLDYDDSTLASFDFVIASVHSKFNMTEKEMTDRIIKAMRNKHVSMLGHPTGRLLLAREAYPVSMKAVLEAAADNGVAIELNANPHRLDIDWRECRYAKSLGVKISINPDAHHVASISDIAYGVGIARKGWLTAADILNAMPLEGFLEALAGRR